ncbi:MAG: hypothetical protein ABF649_17015 [Bacillus sp. (in: firmicutes)]
MVTYGNPYQAIPSGPMVPGGYPPAGAGFGAPSPYGAPYGTGYGGAWYALLIILFIVILVFGSFWYIGNQFY